MSTIATKNTVSWPSVHVNIFTRSSCKNQALQSEKKLLMQAKAPFHRCTRMDQNQIRSFSTCVCLHMQHTAGASPHQVNSQMFEILRMVRVRGGARMERTGLGPFAWTQMNLSATPRCDVLYAVPVRKELVVLVGQISSPFHLPVFAFFCLPSSQQLPTPCSAGSPAAFKSWICTREWPG